LAIANALQLEVARRPASRSIHRMFLRQIPTAHAHKLIFPGFRSNLLTLPLDLAPRFHKREQFWRLDNVFTLWPWS